MTTDLTTFFGFTRVGTGEQVSKNAYAALDADKVTQDSLFRAALTHTHNGDPALGNPTDAPALEVANTGGTLPAGTSLFYRVSFVDQYGLESAASPEASVVTTDAITAPGAVTLTVVASGGSLGAGSYSYLATFVDAQGGETEPGTVASIQVSSGAANRVTLTLPDLDPDAVKFRIYRTKPGQSALYKIGETTSTSFSDTGVAEDQTITVPSINTTFASNSVTVTIPGAFIPDGCAAWRIYRASASGSYPSSALVHHVVETTSSTTSDLVIEWIDTGSDLRPGFPREVSATAPQGSTLDLTNLTGSLPVSAVPRGVQCLQASKPGAITNSDIILITECASTVKPVRVTGYFRTAPTTGGVTVRARVTDSASNYVELSCSPTTHLGGDPTGFFRKEYPLLEEAKFEAENGTRSTGVLIDTELAASNSQAVGLVDNNDMVTFDLGTLEPGTYNLFVTARVVAFDTVTTGDDLTFVVVRSDTNATIGSAVVFDLEATNPTDPPSVPADFVYQELTGPSITAPGGVDLHLKVYKSTVSNQSYEIDFARYEAVVPSLVPGLLTTELFVDGGTTDATDLSLCLWF